MASKAFIDRKKRNEDWLQNSPVALGSASRYFDIAWRNSEGLILNTSICWSNMHASSVISLILSTFLKG
jgi:hypothetical protein